MILNDYNTSSSLSFSFSTSSFFVPSAIGEYVTRIRTKLFHIFFTFLSIFPTISLSHTHALTHFPPISHGCVAVVSSQMQTNVKESSSETKFKIKTFYLVSTHNFNKLLMHRNLVSDASTIILSLCVCALYRFKFHDLFFWCRDNFFRIALVSILLIPNLVWNCAEFSVTLSNAVARHKEAPFKFDTPSVCKTFSLEEKMERNT